MKINQTPCCAMSILSGLNNQTSEEDLEALIVQKEKERDERVAPGVRLGVGETILLATTSPAEGELAEKLERHGFVRVLGFPRRTGYPAGEITLWVVYISGSERGES